MVTYIWVNIGIGNGNTRLKVTPKITKAKIYGIVVFGYKPHEAGVTQLHERRSLECNWVTPAEVCSLSNHNNICSHFYHANGI